MIQDNTTSNKERAIFVALVIFGGVSLVLGWQLFWFLTDDAFIAFRYVSNSILGRGYVWNVAPFSPVEGYTSFLWVVVLDIVWRAFGVEPPQSANVLSLAFAFATMILTMLMVKEVPLYPPLQKWRLVFVFLLLPYLLLNRTFLAWTSSGLETAMFGFFVVLWVYVLNYVNQPLRKVGFGSLVAALLALSRPDGLLFCAAMIAVMFIEFLRTPDRLNNSKILLCGLVPLSVPAVHQAWRLSFYGEWFPNTYYAKVTAAWPESGVRYVLSYILEYALWLPIIIILGATLVAVVHARPWITSLLVRNQKSSSFKELVIVQGVPFLTVITLLTGFGYYTFLVGGDHFEYRIYNHLIPLVFLLVLWSLSKLRLRPVTALSLMLAVIIFSLPVQWTHWQLTRNLNSRNETHAMIVPISWVWPAPLRWYAELFDDAQSWLITRRVGMRHQEHKVFWQSQAEAFPAREVGMRVPVTGYPVFANGSVGMPAWTLPNVNLIDTLGLNDHIVARTSIVESGIRMMAHDRTPPEGYVESFRPNVIIDAKNPVVVERQPELKAEEVRKLEASWREKLKNQELVLVPAVQGSLLPPQLVVNSNFEQGFFKFSPYSKEPGEVGNGWIPFIISGRPTFRDTAAMNSGFVARIDGGTSQTVWSWGNPFVAGLYQLVSSVEPGHAYSAWYATSSAYISGAPPGLQRTIGIDPFGGTDPVSSKVIWGTTYDDAPWATKDAGNAPMVTAIAKNSTITLYIKVISTATDQKAYQAFIDGVVLVDIGIPKDTQTLTKDAETRTLKDWDSNP